MTCPATRKQRKGRRDEREGSSLCDDDDLLHRRRGSVRTAFGGGALRLRLRQVKSRRLLPPNFAQEVLVPVAVEEEGWSRTVAPYALFAGAQEYTLSIAAQQDQVPVFVHSRQVVGVAREICVAYGEFERHARNQAGVLRPYRRERRQRHDGGKPCDESAVHFHMN